MMFIFVQYLVAARSLKAQDMSVIIKYVRPISAVAQDHEYTHPDDKKRNCHAIQKKISHECIKFKMRISHNLQAVWILCKKLCIPREKKL